MNDREAFLALNMLEGIGPITVIKLLKEYGNASAIFREKSQVLELFPLSGTTQQMNDSPLKQIRNWKEKINLSQELMLIEKNGIEIITLDSEEYPKLLREIPDPPIVLYIMGNPKVLSANSLGIVGSRKTTDYGIQVAAKISTNLALNGISVCVLGHGMGQTYPAENKNLYKRLAEDGAVITQFPFHRKGDRQTFPIRNRIVAGLTMGTIVVEASLSSGAMITARMAIEYNREVYAVPGVYGSKHSEGCHQLIREGAVLLDSMDPVFQNSEQLFPNSSTSSNHHRMAKGQEIIPNESTTAIESSLEPNQQNILKILGANPLQFDQIVQLSRFPVPIVQVALLKLEMLDLVRSHPGNCYSRKS